MTLEQYNLALFKALSDDARLKIIRALAEKDMYVELLAERLQLSAPTVSFHMKKLAAAGLIQSRREQYYVMYSLRRERLERSLASLILDGGEENAEAMREEQYRRKVIRAFMPDGYCETLPAQVKKRTIIYREIFSLFEPGRDYPEKEVNEIIARMHGDFCLVRRVFVEMGWMTREKGIYRVAQEDPAATRVPPEDLAEG